MSPQSLIAHYRIVSKLGEGGMGAVYRATDTKLNRDVAIKILPDRLANDPEYLARFTREAQVLAALNHPNIATVYGVEDRAIVMELVEGHELSIPLPLKEALPVARQIAEALEAAHEKGIVHRDLKPANIKVTADGRVKVLDFGLAKSYESQPASADSPTMTMTATHPGIILGTAGYMAPEQARGKAVDKRADVWAFGVVLFELLTGRQLFAAGDTITDIIAAVVTREPDWSALPGDTPAHIRWMLKRCLTKDPKLRLRDIGEARIALESEAVDIEPARARSVRKPGRWWAAACAALALLAAGLAAVHFRETPAQPEVIRFTMQPPDGTSFSTMLPALSPDGRKLVFGAISSSGSTPVLWVRSLDTLESTALKGTENAAFPFWSPDGRLVGFWSEGKLRRVDLLGGPPQDICDTTRLTNTGNAASTWSPDGYIYFGAGGSGLFRVPQGGGEPVLLAAPIAAQGEVSYFYPQILPDRKHLLYHVFAVKREENAAYVTTLDGKQRKRVLISMQASAFVPAPARGVPAHLLFLRQDALLAQPVDGQTYEPSGDAFLVANGVGSAGNYGFFTVAANGMIAYRSGVGSRTRQLRWFDRAGKVLSTLGEPGDYQNIALSPDGSRVAVVQQDAKTGNRDIWIVDPARNVFTRFTFDEREDTDPVWSPDGLHIAFSRRMAPHLLYLKDVNGAKPEERLDKTFGQRASDWSRDGKYLLFVRFTRGLQGIWTLSGPAGDPSQRKASPYLEGPYNLTYPQFAPGAGGPRWVAYSSDESLRSQEIFVQSFPAAGARFQVSNGGGTQPRWRRDGKELFYLTPDGKLMAVDVKIGDSFHAGAPRLLFQSRFMGPLLNTWRYDVSPDGQRFLVMSDARNEAGAPEFITVVTNWLAGVKR